MINTTPTTPVAPPPIASNIQYPQSSTAGISSTPGSLRPVLPPAARPPLSLPSSRSSSAASTASVSNSATSTAAPPPATGLSFQTMRPETEWNDLPDDMVALNGDRARSTHLSPPSAGGSAASSRSSSASRSKKKNRSYPAAAFKN